MWNEFKKFILRGNVVDLAVAVLLGTAFNQIITALTKDMITPLISAITGNTTNFSNYSFRIHNSVFAYGAVINTIVSFFLIALVVFFLVVQPINKVTEYRKKYKNVDPTEKECPECLSTIPAKATRCAFCTSKLSTN